MREEQNKSELICYSGAHPILSSAKVRLFVISKFLIPLTMVPDVTVAEIIKNHALFLSPTILYQALMSSMSYTRFLMESFRLGKNL